MSEDKKELKLVVPGEWALEKTLGPVLGEIGKDIAQLYQKGVENIAKAAKRKIGNKKDGKSANLRVARDVFWNGSYTDDTLSAEYFGGILASSRSNDGTDDSMIYFVDIVKSLSSKQLKLHYLIYRAFNELLVDNNDKADVNLALSADLGRIKLYLNGAELVQNEVNIETDFVALHAKGLLSQYQFAPKTTENGKYRYIDVEVTPTTLGFQLYGAASNNIGRWANVSKELFDTFPDVNTLGFKSFSNTTLKDWAENATNSVK
jgi:hypothetical protein